MRRLGLRIGYTLLFNWLVLTGFIYGQPEKVLPDFSFVTHEGEKLEASKFRNNRPLIVLYFEPTCSHCEQQAGWIAAEIERFGETDLLWVAWQPTNDIPGFRSKYFPQTENVFFAIDSEDHFDGLFGFSQIPTIYIYSPDNILLKKFKKETRAEKLLKALKQ